MGQGLSLRLARGPPKYITTITQLRQIEQLTVERMLPDAAPGAGDACQGEVRCAPRDLEGPASLPPPAQAA